MKFTRLAAACVLPLLGVSTAGAGVILQIDVSNPSAVKFMATTQSAQGNSTLTVGYDGFTIQNLFSSAVRVFQDTVAASSDLRPAGTADAYEGLATVDFEGNLGTYATSNDLNLFSITTPFDNPQVFSTTSRAFEGVMTVDLSEFLAALPAVGSSGQIYSGYLQSGTAGQGVVIGQFLVIPEPASGTAFGLSMALLVWKRRRA